MTRCTRPAGTPSSCLSPLRSGSVRRVTAVLEKLCGTSISSTEVSRVAAQLDPLTAQWRTRPLDPIRHILLDARYEKVRVAGAVRSCAVLIAIGIREVDGPAASSWASPSPSPRPKSIGLTFCIASGSAASVSPS